MVPTESTTRPLLAIAHKRTRSYLAAIEMHKQDGEGVIPSLV